MCVSIYIYVNIYIFQILFTYRLLLDIERDSLCYGRSLLFIYFIYKINNNNNLNFKTRSFVVSAVVFVVQLPSRVWLFVTPRNCRHARPPCPSPSPSLPKCMSVESVMPSNLLSPSFPAFNFPRIRVFSSKPALCIRWQKYCSFSFSISPFNEHPGLISFRMDWWISLQSKGLSRVFSTPQFKSTSSALSFLYSQTLNAHMTTGKIMAVTVWAFVSKAKSLLFNTPSHLGFFKSLNFLVSGSA